MQKLRLLAALALSGFGLYGCQTSCGEQRDPVLWADGITQESGGRCVYQTTAVDGRWLHFPSNRAFRLPHHFGTTNIDIHPYISFEEKPVSRGTSDPPAELAIVSGNTFTVTEWTEDEIVVENGSCENDYYVFVQITNMDKDPACPQ